MVSDWLKSLESQVLLAHILGRSRTWLLTHPQTPLTPAQRSQMQRAWQQLENGEPLPYLLGKWEFFGLEFEVSPAVLIPRPETELLVETALAFARAQPQPVYRCIDVGTGSGILPICLATHLPQAQCLATDLSAAALRVAKRNAQKHGVQNRVQWVQTNLLQGLALPPFDILTANLPYIPSAALRELPIFGREPSLALDGGADGLDLFRGLFALLTVSRAKGRLLLLEMEYRQGAALRALAREAFPDADIRIQKDLAGLERMLVVDFSSNV